MKSICSKEAILLPFKDFGLSSEEFSKYSSFSALMITPLTATVMKPYILLDNKNDLNFLVFLVNTFPSYKTCFCINCSTLVVPCIWRNSYCCISNPVVLFIINKGESRHKCEIIKCS